MRDRAGYGAVHELGCRISSCEERAGVTLSALPVRLEQRITDVTAKIKDMERQGMVQSFLDMIDSAHGQTKGLHGLMEAVRARVIVAAAKTVQAAEEAA